MKALVIMALAILASTAPVTAQAQYNEPDMVIAIHDCTAVLDVHTLSLIRQVDRDTITLRQRSQGWRLELLPQVRR